MLTLAALLVCAAAQSYMIPNVPYHRQITPFACGDASTEMALHFYGADVDQRAIMDVARTTEQEGTLSYDVVRAGQFSYIRAAVGDLYPKQSPQHGWKSPGRPRLGYAAFGYREEACWIDELKELIANNIPVLMLMHFAYPIVAHDGHFRVAVGFDDDNVYLHDPWDRPADKDQPDSPRLAVYNNTVLCAMWNYREKNINVTYDPYFAAAFLPWQVVDDALNRLWRSHPLLI